MHACVCVCVCVCVRVCLRAAACFMRTSHCSRSAFVCQAKLLTTFLSGSAEKKKILPSLSVELLGIILLISSNNLEVCFCVSVFVCVCGWEVVS